MKILIATLIALSSSYPALADEYQSGYSRTRTCNRLEYREEYIPGTSRANPGTVRSWEETIEVPCDSPGAKTVRRAVPQPIGDNNDCSQGSLIGGLLGAGLATSSSRGKGRWWAIPAGGAAGAMIGCQMDGG